jgi:uncharacterized membrane protein YdbT with pleckstrin-like domain
MSYIDNILQPGEVVLIRTRLHWFIYLRPIAIIVVALAVLAAGAFVAPNIRLFAQVAGLVLGVVGLGRFFVAWLRRHSTELAVTDRRVMHKTGFFSRSTQEMNREKVESVDVEQSLPGRLFGYGTVLVRGVGSTWEPFAHIAAPLAFRSHITAA